MSVMGAFNYSYANARIHGMRSKLLSEKQMRAAFKIQSLTDFFAFLESSYYREAIYQKETKTYKEIERALFADLMRTKETVLNLSPAPVRGFLSEYFKRHEIQCLKNILYSKAGGSVNPLEIDMFAFGRKFGELPAKLKEAKSVEDIVIALERTDYGFLRHHIEDYKNSNSVLKMILALDSNYFRKLQDSANQIPSKDKEIAADMIGLETDAINIMILLRRIKMENIEQFLVLPSRGISQDVIEMCLKASSVDDVIAELSETAYGKVLSSALDEFQKTNSLLPFESALDRHMLFKRKELSLGDPFQIGTIISYLALKENEIKNLRAICIAIAHNLPREEIKDSIFFH